MSTMPKLNIILDEDLNKRVRKYLFDTYPDSQYGKLKNVVEEALKEYLVKRNY
jgi:hypothetical protein